MPVCSYGGPIVFLVKRLNKGSATVRTGGHLFIMDKPLINLFAPSPPGFFRSGKSLLLALRRGLPLLGATVESRLA